jgi:hypothetical protein
MKMQYVPNAVSRKVARTALHVSKHSPAILFGTGVVGFGATVFLACRATLKVEDVLVDAQKTTQDIKGTVTTATYPKTEQRRDLAYHYVNTTGRLLTLYGPAVAVGTLSVAALTGSHHILTKRNAGLSAAYAALGKGFEEYRKRVVGELGEDKDREFRYGVVTTESIETTTDGKKVKGIRTFDPRTGASIYARVFDQFNPNWQGRPEYNRIFLTGVQNYMNDRLYARGHVFLNEVYDALGMDRSEAGSVVGWYLRKNIVEGDNNIDFGMFNRLDQAQIDFINGREGAILLDFNVDGQIYNMLGDGS